MTPEGVTPEGGTGPPRSTLHTLSDIAWRSLVIAAAVLAVAYALARLRLVVVPLFVALLLSTLLVPLVRFLEGRGWRPLFATVAVFLGFLGVLTGIGFLIVPALVDEFGSLGPTLSEGVADIERWLVEGPLDLEPEQVARYRQGIGDQLRELSGSGGGIVSGAILVGEVVAGAVLALVLSFFFMKDGPLIQRWALAHLPARHHEVVRTSAARAYRALAAYLRGAAFIGLIEATVIGIALFIVGARLVLPVAVLTFAAAFFPIVGAVVAGLVAVLVALVSGGLPDALVIAVVALAVQQFDNDLLAPLIYGRFVKLHPVVVLLSLTAGGAIAGIIGAFVAVPVAATSAAVGNELWRRHSRDGDPATA